LHWLLKYLKARNVKNKFTNCCLSVPRDPDLQHYSKPFDWMKSSTRQGTEIQGLFRTRVANCAPILDISQDDRKTAADTASHGIVIGVVQAICKFSQLGSQPNHSDLSLRAPDDALERLSKSVAFQGQKLSKSVKPKVDDQLA
jgi:hypothetical protein